MSLLPVLPVLPDETLTSYLRRVAKFHAGIGNVYSFLSALDLSRAAVIDPSTETLERIGALTNQSLDTLQGMVIRSIQPRVRALGNEHFHTEFANLKQTTYCPVCLLEDAAPDSPSAGLRVGRVSWRLSTVRTCSKHHTALIRATMTTKSHRFQHMDEVAPDDATLAQLVETTERRAPSALQGYVESRLIGVKGPEWLDAQPIDIGARTCEMLGLLMTQPVTRKMPDVSDSDLDSAGAVGFLHASEGEAGIRAALNDVRACAMATGGVGGPAQVFGFFYYWLQDLGKKNPSGSMQNLLREYIINNFAIEPGTVLFGIELKQEKKHTVDTLARKLRSNPRTVQRALVYAALLDGEPERPSHHVTFDADPAEALFTRINTALSNRELRSFLNCHRAQAEQLVNFGILPQIIAQGDRGQNAAQHVARDDAKAFLEKMIDLANLVETPTDGMFDIPRAARASGWSVVDIVRVLIAGRLCKIECVDPELRFLGVLVDPAEVCAVLRQEHSDDLVDFAHAARTLGIKRYGMRKFIQQRDPNGKPFLTLHTITNAEGSAIEFLSRKEVDRFLKRHISLVEIASQVNSHPKFTKAQLAKAGITPIVDAQGIGRTFYRRENSTRALAS